MIYDLKNVVDKIVVVDPGKNTVKIFGFDTDYNLLKRYSFPSKTMEKRNFADIDGATDDQYKIEINNKKYIVGDGVMKNYNFETTKNNLHHKLCIYTAIANLVEKEDEKIYLIVGYPSSDFTNMAQRNAYLDLLRPQVPAKKVEMIVNSLKKRFIIEDIAVYPEGSAIRPRMHNAGKNVHVIDIGGQNINYREYDAKGNTLNSFSLDKAGINHLEEHIKNQLRKFVLADIINVESINFTKAIETGKIEEIDSASNITSDNLITNYETSEEFVADAIASFIDNNVLGQLLSRDVNLYSRGNLIIFTGGGSIILKPYLKDILKNNEGNMYFSTTAQWDNCISYITRDLGERGKKEGKIKGAQIIAQKIMKQVSIDEYSIKNK